MLIGYARVSTGEQNIDLQRRALWDAGCEQIHEDIASGASSARNGLQSALKAAQGGDVLVVWKIDRLGRSLSHLVTLLDDLHRQGVGFRVLTGEIDTTTPVGRMQFGLIATLAEFERALIAERTKAGIAARKARGELVGRRRALTQAQVNHARQLVGNGEQKRHVARLLNVSPSTLYRALRNEI